MTLFKLNFFSCPFRHPGQPNLSGFDSLLNWPGVQFGWLRSMIQYTNNCSHFSLCVVLNSFNKNHVNRNYEERISLIKRHNIKQ